MRSIIPWIISFACILLLVIGIMAGASYSHQADFQNQTDTFGNTHSQQDNQTAAALGTMAEGSAGIAPVALIGAAFMFIIAIIIVTVALTRRPKW